MKLKHIRPQCVAITQKGQRCKMKAAKRDGTLCEYHDGDRSYLAYVPAKLPFGSALVIVLHGSGMDGKKMRKWTGYEFDRMADQRGFVVLYPDGYRGNWNDCRKNAIFATKRRTSMT